MFPVMSLLTQGHNSVYVKIFYVSKLECSFIEATKSKAEQDTIKKTSERKPEEEDIKRKWKGIEK